MSGMQPRPLDRGAPPGALGLLALRLADHARRLGLTPLKISASRCTNSNSRYLTVIDRKGSPWVVRISDHESRQERGHPRPHWGLVSRDGIQGYAPTVAFLEQVARGELRWTDPMADVRQPKRKPKKRRHR